MNDAEQSAAGRVICPAAKDPAVRVLIGAAMALGLGLWMGYDAYVANKYPYPHPYNINDYAKYVLNHYGPFVLVPIGLALVVWAVVMLRRVLVADGEGLGYEGGAKHLWATVTSVDAALLASKGILVLGLQGGAKLVLDAWKLRNFKELVAFVEAHLPPGVSVGT
ncbi:MAG: hypothetical protein ABSH10_04350 [Phycisphaerae bacterium]|jgi:hypothetical protein